MEFEAGRFDFSQAAMARAGQEPGKLVAIQHADMFLVVSRDALHDADRAGMSYCMLDAAFLRTGRRVTLKVNG